MKNSLEQILKLGEALNSFNKIAQAILTLGSPDEPKSDYHVSYHVYGVLQPPRSYATWRLHPQRPQSPTSFEVTKH